MMIGKAKHDQKNKMRKKKQENQHIFCLSVVKQNKVKKYCAMYLILTAKTGNEQNGLRKCGSTERERERNVIYSLYADCRQNNKMDGKSGYGAISDLNEKKKKLKKK